jgi:vacuolar-type H+-ATPase subunit I/STV1
MDEVTQYANEGGDTEAETAKVIKERNAAMQELADKQADIAKKRAEAEQEAYDAQIEAEKAVADSSNALVTGEPVITQPAAHDRSSGGPKKAASKSE